jgi:hypothetical protein
MRPVPPLLTEMAQQCPGGKTPQGCKVRDAFLLAAAAASSSFFSSLTSSAAPSSAA